jgi:hypothetical protein
MNSNFDDPLPTVEGVERTQNIYRIIDFFAAAQAVERGTLYVPLAQTFTDANEAIEAAIEVLAVSAGPCAGITTQFGSAQELIQYQKSVAKRTYVSCWTRTKESVAMWGLYSQDKSSVQITTTVGSLERAASALANAESSPMHAISHSVANGQFFDFAKIAPVKYEDWEKVARLIDRRRRAYDKLETAGRIRTDSDQLSSGIRDGKRAGEYRFEALKHKGQSYSHESEVRLIINYTPYDTNTLRIAKQDVDKMEARYPTNLDDPRHELSKLRYARAILRDEAWRRGMQCITSILLPLQSGFVKEVTIDPRCPEHKRSFMQSYFETRGIPIARSSCFSHAVGAFSVRARKKLTGREGA